MQVVPFEDEGGSSSKLHDHGRSTSPVEPFKSEAVPCAEDDNVGEGPNSSPVRTTRSGAGNFDSRSDCSLKLTDVEDVPQLARAASALKATTKPSGAGEAIGSKQTSPASQNLQNSQSPRPQASRMSVVKKLPRMASKSILTGYGKSNRGDISAEINSLSKVTATHCAPIHIIVEDWLPCGTRQEEAASQQLQTPQ